MKDFPATLLVYGPPDLQTSTSHAFILMFLQQAV